MQPKPPQDHVPSQRRRRALRAGAALAALACGPVTFAAAQGARTFPAAARLGRLEMRVFPEAILDDVPVRLGAGARIHDERNLIVLPASLSGARDVLIERDHAGNILRVWLLTAEELKAAQERERARASGGAAVQNR